MIQTPSPGETQITGTSTFGSVLRTGITLHSSQAAAIAYSTPYLLRTELHCAGADVCSVPIVLQQSAYDTSSFYENLVFLCSSGKSLWWWRRPRCTLP